MNAKRSSNGSSDLFVFFLKLLFLSFVILIIGVLMSGCAASASKDKEKLSVAQTGATPTSPVLGEGKVIEFPSEGEAIALAFSVVGGDVLKAENAVARELARIIKEKCGNIPVSQESAKLIKFAVGHDETHAYAAATVDASLCPNVSAKAVDEDNPFSVPGGAHIVPPK